MAARYQWLRACLVHAMAVVAPAASCSAIRTASSMTASSSTHFETSPMRSASSPLSGSQVIR